VVAPQAPEGPVYPDKTGRPPLHGLARPALPYCQVYEIANRDIATDRSI
jgi:hypothetical protein